MAKSQKKLVARKQRREGKSIKEIAKNLDVSPGSVSVWVRDIFLTENQIKNLQKRRTDAYFGKKAEYIKKRLKRTENKINILRNKGIKEVGRLSKREIFLTGIALYWGEGFKKDHQVGFATSDLRMAQFFIFWFKKCFGIDYKDLILRVTANISYIEKIKALEQFWSRNLKIPIDQFSKPFFQNVLWKKEYENKDEYHGILRIRVRRSMDFLRKIFGYMEGIYLNTL